MTDKKDGTKKNLESLENNLIRRKWTKKDERILRDIEEKLFPKTYDNPKQIKLTGTHILAFLYLSLTSIAFPYAVSGWSGASWWDHFRLMISILCIVKMSVVFDNLIFD